MIDTVFNLLAIIGVTVLVAVIARAFLDAYTK